MRNSDILQSPVLNEKINNLLSDKARNNCSRSQGRKPERVKRKQNLRSFICKDSSTGIKKINPKEPISPRLNMIPVPDSKVS